MTTVPANNHPLLRVEGLRRRFGGSSRLFGRRPPDVVAVDGVDFEIQKGETLSLVGESGCGKSTTGRLVARLLTPSEGRIFFEGEDIGAFDDARVRALRRRVQMIFQDPYSSLNPRKTVGEIIAAPFHIQNVSPPGGIERAVGELINLVGLNPEHHSRFPREFSGGQRQRIGIARALALKPKLVVCDEPVSALDVSVQAQVVNLLKDLQAEFGLSYLFIAHDLAVVRHISDRVAVMYLGRIMEIADAATLYSSPAHPYTKALIASAPVPDPSAVRGRARVALRGELPSSSNPPSGCSFHTRCPVARERCAIDRPSLETLTEGHQVACHFASEVT